MEPQNENPIPSHDPRKIIKIVAVASAILLVLIIGIVLSFNKGDTKKSGQNLSSQNSAKIEITKDGFLPATLTVPKGTKVTWTNKDKAVHRVASNPHPTHEGLKGLDSKDVIGIEGGTYSFNFDKPGTYTYHDHLNPTTNGTVVVE